MYSLGFYSYPSRFALSVTVNRCVGRLAPLFVLNSFVHGSREPIAVLFTAGFNNDVLFFVGNVHDSGLAWRRLSERPGVCSDKSSFKHGEITWEGKTIVRASFSNRPCTKPALTLVTLVCVPHAQTTWYFQASKQNEDPTHGIAAQLRNEGWAVQSGSVDESDDESSDEDCS